MSRFKFPILALMLVFASITFIRKTLEVYQNSQRLYSLRAEVAGLESDRITLQGEIDSIDDPSFIEEKARNSLNLMKPNEDIFVIPEDLTLDASSVTSEIVTKNHITNPTVPQKWLEVFF